MSQPRGKGGNPSGRKQPNQGGGGGGGNAWGNQGRGDARPQNQRPASGQNQRPPSNQNQQPPNFADANAFGPPLGGRARPNRNPNAAPPASRDPAPSTSRAPAPPVASQPPQPSGSTQAVNPSAWGQKKRIGEGDSSGSSTKYHSDEKTRGEAARGAIHGNRPERNLALIETRPTHISAKQGSSGRSFTVKANYFALNSKAQWQIFHYHVEFTPEVENPSFRNLLLAQQRPNIGSFLYDRGSSIFTVHQLEAERFEITTRDRDQNEILIRITKVGLISTLEMRFIQFLNIIVKKTLKELNLQRISRDYFDPAAKIDIRTHNIELWPGYTTSIRQHERSLLMMAEIKHKLMRTETLLDVLNRCYNESRTNWQQAFVQQVLGMIVLTRYNNKTYRISDVLFDASPSNTFETRAGPRSYVDYYLEKHGIRITNPQQPLLRSTPTERDIRGARGRDEEPQPINLVPELCTPTGYTDEMRRNFNLMRDVAVHTRVGPAQRIQKLMAFNNRLHTTPGSIACFREWALDLDRDLVNVQARELPAEEIQLGKNAKVRTENAGWTNALQGRNSMYSSENLGDNQWAAIVPKSLERDAQAFIKTIQEVSRGMAFNVGAPQIFNVQDDRSTTLSTILDTVCNQNKKMVLVMVSNNQADRYSIIKKVCSVRHAVPSQVVTRRVMDARDMRKMRSVATKVAIQMNSKIGGMPWAVDVKLNNCMFIGYDVCHDTRDRSRSYGAVVATMDMRRSTRFFSAVSAHQNGEELSNNLSLNVTAALRQYKEIHKVLPDRILFYRDGVGEGQTNYVYEHELQNLLNALKKFYGEQPVKLAFVIVSKRINTKFFTEKGQGAATNVPPGTVVDDVVTLPERYDFFLVSQAVNQGTATPTNYNVIYDSFGLPPDKLQMMTFKMCHLYYNWSGTTRVPAVCQYAHKLAFLVGNFLHQAPRLELSPYLYFL